MQRFLILIVLTVVTQLVPLSSGSEGQDVVRPVCPDLLKRVSLHRSELGGELNRRIEDLIYKNYMVLDLEKNWLNYFRHRTDRGTIRNIYYGIGKVIDAGSLFASYTGDSKVAARTRYLVEELRKTRDQDGYLGFWKVEPNNLQNHINWILHEQEYINLALTRYYRTTGDAAALNDAKIMADYIMKSFPVNQQGIFHIPAGISIAGITESFIELYRLTGEKKYFDFAQHVQYEPHWFYEPYNEWAAKIGQRPFHLYVMLSHMYPETELYRLTGRQEYLLKSRWIKQELLEDGHGALLVTGSSSQGEHFTYNQNGAGAIEESCVTAYLLRLFDSLLRLEGDLRYGDVIERTIYNALFAAQEPNGRHICYFTPFSGKRSFQEIDTFCCNGNFRRAVAELPQKVWYRTENEGIALNLYTASDKTFKVRGESVRIQEETDYPNSGSVKLTLTVSNPIRFALRLRTPRWCKTFAVAVNKEAPRILDPKRQTNGGYEIDRTWNSGDIVTISMPMSWRLVQGRATQKGRAALMRGPVLFGIGENQNGELLKSVGSPRDLVLDPNSIGQPIPDSSIRPNGLKVRAKVWTDSKRTGPQKDVVLTEFTDPSGVEIYFILPEKADVQSIPIVNDEIIAEPKTRSRVDILSAIYGPKVNGDLKKVFNIQGKLRADLAKDYIPPQGAKREAVFPDQDRQGNWSIFACPDQKALEQSGYGSLLHSQNEVYETPNGFAYGQQNGAKLGFVSLHEPSDRQGPLWKENFTEKALDLFIPEEERKNFVYLHPVADPNSALVFNWKRNKSQTESAAKFYTIDGTIVSRPAGNGVTFKIEAVRQKGEKQVRELLTDLATDKERTGMARVFDFQLHLSTDSLSALDFIVGNNGDYFTDSTAVRIQIYESKNEETQKIVTDQVRSKFIGELKTELGDYQKLFGAAPKGATGPQTLKLKLRSQESGTIFYKEFKENAPLENLTCP